MSILFPWFLAAFAALAAPIFFHFRQKQTKDITKFSSLMFLETAPIKQRTKSKIQHWLLLITRCLIFALLAFAFARPFFHKAIAALEGEPAEKVVILVDRSASMKREGLWEAAIKKVESVVGDLKPEDLLHVRVFDSTVETIFSFEDSKSTGAIRTEKLLQELENVQPTWHSTDLGKALVSAAEAIEQGEDSDEADGESELADAEGRVIVISDAQNGADTEKLKSFLWPEKVTLEFESLVPEKKTNASLQLIPEAKGISHSNNPSRYFRIENAASSETDMFTVRWRNADGSSASEALTVKVAPGEKAVLKAPDTATGLPAPILELAGDDHDFDNRAYTEAVAAKQVRILYVGNEPENDPLTARFFLKRALFPTRTLEPELTTRLPDDTFEPEVLRLYDLIVIASDGPLPNAALFGEYVENGGRILFLIHTAEAASGLAEILNLDELTAQEAEIKDYQLLGAINRRHPLLAAFADARYGDFTNVHFWAYRKLNTDAIPEAGVLSRFDNGDPAWFLTPKGKGTVLTFTSSWRRGDSQLALSTKFIPLLYSILSNQAASNEESATVHVGEPFPISVPSSKPDSANAKAEQITDDEESETEEDPQEESEIVESSIEATITYPSGKKVPFVASDGVFRDTDEPGLYTVEIGDKTSVVAVNLDPDESELDPFDTEVLSKSVEPEVVEDDPALKVDEEATEAEQQKQRDRAEDVKKEKRQRIWRYLIFAVLALILFEIWYSAHCRKNELKSQEKET